MKIQFLGSTREVTGSKHLITLNNGKKILLDCGMYQGKGMETDAMNRNLGFSPREIDHLILSHAHIDHSGLIPYVAKLGFEGSIIATHASRDLCTIMLADCGKIQEYDTENLRQVVSYVDQKPYLFDFSVKDNVLLGRDVDKTYEKACSTAHVDFVDLYSEDVKIDEFSDGQRQRIGIARGIVGSPLLLILDEATSAIDSETEAHIFRGLKQMSTTIIVLSHRLSTLKSTDRTFVLHDGQIIDSGTHDELVQKCPVYTQIFEEKEE